MLRFPPPVDSLDRAGPTLGTFGMWAVEGLLSELLPVSATFSTQPNSFFPQPSLVGPLGLERLLEPRAMGFSGRNPKKLSWGNGPDLVFILLRPKDDARIGDTDAAAGGPEHGAALGSIWASLPLPSFFFDGELGLPGLEEEVVVSEV